jgi:EAL domain-containing protein (putative c-di-GMP-specific phosphodiesterase class I)
MGIRTIAEFVETEAVLARLRLLGVDYAQGHHLARPAPLPSPEGWSDAFMPCVKAQGAAGAADNRGAAITAVH